MPTVEECGQRFDLCVLRRAKAPPLRFRGRLVDRAAAGDGALIVELWQRARGGYALAVRWNKGCDLHADAWVVDRLDAAATRLERLGQHASEMPAHPCGSPAKGQPRAIAAQTILLRRHRAAARQHRLDALISTVLDRWARDFTLR